MSRLVARVGNEIVSPSAYYGKLPVYASRAAIPAASAVDGASVLLRIGTNLTPVVYDSSRGLWVGAETYDLITNGPPAAPMDGDIWRAAASSEIIWIFRYNASSVSAHKWEYIGGSPVQVQDDAILSTTSATPVVLGTLGAITTPRAGDYYFEYGANAYTTSAGQYIYSQLTIGGVSIAVTFHGTQTAGLWQGASWRRVRVNGVASAAVVDLRHYTSGGATGTVGTRTLAATPIRVS